jgi:hypothetical protein
VYITKGNVHGGSISECPGSFGAYGWEPEDMGRP